ncbi:Sin3 associated polypeptide p18-domain-containing protein [Scleroderma yunnanense]
MADMDTTSAGQPIVSREKTAPFLIRTFVKVGTFHRLSLFEEGTLPTTDEQQIFTWKDATLREVLTTLRSAAPQIPELRHPLAKYSFRAIYADAANRGRFAQKELGMVYSRDILGEPGNLESPAPRLLEDVDNENREPTEREKEERSLDELRFVPGDYLCVSVILPKSATGAAVQGEVAPNKPLSGANGWRGAPAARPTDAGWGSRAPAGRGGGHWRGESNPSPPGGRGRGGRGDFAGRDRDFDHTREPERRVPPPRRDSPPQRGGRGGGRGGRRSPSGSRSRSPPRRRPSRYD